MRFVDRLRPNSLRVKILLAYLTGMVFSIALLVGVVSIAFQGGALARMDLGGLAEDMAAMVRFDAGGRPVGLDADWDDLAWAFDSLRQETAYRVLDDAGAVVVRSGAGTPFWPPGEGAGSPPRGRFEFVRDGVTVLGATEPVVHAGHTWHLQVAVSSRLMTLFHRVAMPLVGAGVGLFGLVLLVAFGLCAYVTLRYTLAPLREVSDTAAAISPRSLQARLRTEGLPTEIVPLVDSFNRVLERLEGGYRVQQEFLGHAAHELKTPLALIRAQIELMGPGDRDQDALLGDVDYMSRQVQQLLVLAEASEAHNYRFAAVPVHDVAAEVADYLRRLAAASGVHVRVSAIDGGAVWHADRGALFTLLKNLLENAIQHAPQPSTVDVEVHRDAVTVRDRGPGVEAELLPRLFERFWRAAHRRDRGAGLGLAICREIAEPHGWRLVAERAEPGLRLRLSVVDPAPVRGEGIR